MPKPDSKCAMRIHLRPARRRAIVVACYGAITGLLGCSGSPRDARDESTRVADLDSAAAPGRDHIWRAHACLQRAQAVRSDTLYPASDSLIRTDTSCRSLPFTARSAGGWQLAYRRTGDTAGYELRADREATRALRISLFSRVLTHEITAESGTIHAREGDSVATWRDPVIGSPLPMLVWVGWCLEQNQTTRDSGIQGYLVHIRPLGPGGIGCLGSPPFHFGADSDVTSVSVNGMQYAVRYTVGALEPESLSSLGEDGEMHTILEWQYNTSYSMTATPVRYGETGIRSYEIDAQSGSARAWITKDRPASMDDHGAPPTEAPFCDWIRGRLCEVPRPPANDGSFGPGLLTILHADQYQVH